MTQLTPAQLEELDAMAPGGDHRKMSSIWKLQMARRVLAGAPGESPAAQRERLLIHKYGSVDQAPALERLKLDNLQRGNPGPPKPVPPVSVADLARNASIEVEAINRRVAELSKPVAGDSVNVMLWKSAEVRRLQDRVVGIWRRVA